MKVQAFKNGFALVSKSVYLPPSSKVKPMEKKVDAETKGEEKDAIPDLARLSIGKPPAHACYGTVSFNPPPNTKIAALLLSTEKVPAEKAKDCDGFISLLKANKRRSVRVQLKDKEQWYEGVVEVVHTKEFSTTEGLLGLRLAENDKELMMLPLGDVIRVVGVDSNFCCQLPADHPENKVEKRELVVEYSGAGGTAVFSFLCKGFNWAPSYTWYIKEGRVDKDAEVTITASATVMNDTDIAGIVDTLETVVGFPQMQHVGIVDPLVSPGTINEFLRAITPGGAGGSGGGGARYNRRPREMQVQMFSNTMSMQSQTLCPTFDEEIKVDKGDDTGEDVHFHTFNKVHLPANGRLSLPIFNVVSTLRDVYRAKVANKSSNDRTFEVWHALKVPNKTNKPWTTAPVMVMQGERFLAQGKVNYTPVGQEAIVDIARALNVRVSYEQSSTRKAIAQKAEYTSWFSSPIQSKKRVFSKVITTKIMIYNGKPMPIDLVVDFKATGDLLNSEPVMPQKNVENVSRNSTSYNIENSSRDLQWFVKPKANDHMVITFETKTYHLE